MSKGTIFSREFSVINVKRNRGNSLALQTQASLTLIRFYLIGYWRLKGNATPSTLTSLKCSVRKVLWPRLKSSFSKALTG